MDTATLVEKQIDEGEGFIEHLMHNGFSVEVAFWVLTSSNELWFLYIASAVVDDKGLAAAYRDVYQELSNIQPRSISRSDIKLIERGNPIAQDAIAYRGDTLATRFHGRKLGNMIVDEAYIYPKYPKLARSAP